MGLVPGLSLSIHGFSGFGYLLSLNVKISLNDCLLQSQHCGGRKPMTQSAVESSSPASVGLVISDVCSQISCTENVRCYSGLSVPPPGQTTLGHGPMDINIQGPRVAAQHCYIENKSGDITLHPCGNLCAVDGLQVTQPVRLSQGRNQHYNCDTVSGTTQH